MRIVFMVVSTLEAKKLSRFFVIFVTKNPIHFGKKLKIVLQSPYINANCSAIDYKKQLSTVNLFLR